MSKARFTLVDLLMWVALAALVAAVLAPMFGEGARGGLITKVAISADGSTAAALFSDGNVRVWRVADGKRMAAISAGQTADFALSADGTMLAASGLAGPTAGYGIAVWDIATGKRVRTLSAHAAAEIAFAPSGSRLAWSSHSGTVELYHAPLESSPAVTLVSPPILFSPKQWNAPVFSPDGAMLAVRNGNDEIVVFDVASGKMQATLEAGSHVAGAMAFSPDGRTLAMLSFLTQTPNLDAGLPLALAPESLFIAFEAEQKSGPVWNFSQVKRHQHKLADAATLGNSVAFLPDGKTLAAAGGNTVALIDADTGETRNLNVNGFIAAVNSGGSVVVTTDLYRVDVYDLPDGTFRRTLWSGPQGIRPGVFMGALVVWLLVNKVRKTAKQMRLCETCGQAFAPANKRDQNVDCPKCRQHARTAATAPSQISRSFKRWLRVLFRLLPLMTCLLLLWYAGAFSSLLLWLLFVPLLLPAWIGLLRVKWYLKRRRTTNERFDVQLAEHCAAACGEIHHVGGLVVWSAGPSKLLAEIEPQIEICRQRLQAAIGDRVPPLDGARALIFADRNGMARYLAELRLPLGAGPRFNGVYLFAPLKKMLIPERELFEQSADPLMRLRALILYRLLEQSDPQFQQGWLTNSLVSVLARSDADDELARLRRRMKAALLAGRTIEPDEFFARNSVRLAHRVRRRGEHALHAWAVQYQTQAWSLAEFLCGRSSTADRRAAFQRFWHDPARRRNAGTALARSFGMSLAELLAEWRASIDQQPQCDHLPPRSQVAGWMLREPLSTVADATALRRKRIVASWTLGELGYVFGADRLIDLVRGDDPLLRQEAVWALECISGEVRGTTAADWQAWWQSVPQAARDEAAPRATPQLASTALIAKSC